MKKTDAEKIYDTEIAPVLLALCQRCEELGFSFVAQVEWEPGKHGRTETQRAHTHASIDQLLVHWAARCHGNVDRLIFTITKHAREYGHSSIALCQLGIPTGEARKQ